MTVAQIAFVLMLVVGAGLITYSVVLYVSDNGDEYERFELPTQEPNITLSNIFSVLKIERVFQCYIFWRNIDCSILI